MAGIGFLALCGSLQIARAQEQFQTAVDPNLPPLQLNASVAYDTNAARSSDELASIRGLVPEDEIYSPSVQLNWEKGLGRGTLYVAGALGYNFYQQNSVLNREDINLTAGFNEQGRICAFTTDGNFARHQSDLQQLTEAITKNTETVTAARSVLKCGQDSRLSGFISLSPNWSDNSAQLLQTSNSRSIPIMVGLSYDMTNIGKLSIFGQYDSTTFPERHNQLGSSLVDDGYQLYTAGIRWERQLGQRLQASVALSGITLQRQVSGYPRFEGFGYEASLMYRITTRLEASLSSSKAVEPADQLNTTYSIDQSFTAMMAYHIGARTKLSLDGQIREHHYFGAQIRPGIDLSSQSTVSADATVNYSLRRDLSLTLTATEERGTADIPIYRYNDARVVLSVSAAF